MSGRELLVSTFGLGRLRPAPGTWGSLPPAGLAWILIWIGAPAWAYNGALLAVAVAFTAICLALGAWAEEHCGGKDPSLVVADETAGQAIALLGVTSAWPALAVAGAGLDFGRFWRVTAAVGAGFVLFRVMDIIKPAPARGLQRLRGGLGVVIDDLIAGVYAGLALNGALLALRWL